MGDDCLLYGAESIVVKGDSIPIRCTGLVSAAGRKELQRSIADLRRGCECTSMNGKVSLPARTVRKHCRKQAGSSNT